MKDRVSNFPNRYRITQVDGSTDLFDLERKDQPSQVGDPLSKATLLKDETAEMYGFDSSAVPNDIFVDLHKRMTYEQLHRVVAGEWTNKIEIELENISRYKDFLIVFSSGTSNGTTPNGSSAVIGVNVEIEFKNLFNEKLNISGDSGSIEKNFRTLSFEKNKIENGAFFVYSGNVYFGENSDTATLSFYSNVSTNYYFRSDAEIIIYAR